MKKGIHPTMYFDATVTDLSSGESFTIASTKKEIVVEVTNLTHPFYTGKHRIVDTENLVKKFEHKREGADKTKILKKKEKSKARTQRTSSVRTGQGLTLKDMLKQMK